MTHPNAEILRAIADGKNVQWRLVGKDRWIDLFSEHGGVISHTTLISLADANSDIQWRVKPEKKTGWINVYVSEHIVTSRHAIIWDTKQEADKNADHDSRIACIQITYEEGEGL